VKLPSDFYRRPTLDVAADLIGKVLVRRLRGGSRARFASGLIVETEAYIGVEDLACHASRGRTPRTEVLFGPAGQSYVYLVYGLHHCLNAVTEAEGLPAAVLIRAIEPLDGLELMRLNRRGVARTTEIGSGPGKLCQAMAIDRNLSGVSLSGREMWIEDRSLRAGPIATSPRIGVGYAGEYREKPWRFFAEGNPHVSGRGTRTGKRGRGRRPPSPI
jgi:DNA-3-methyladenine glycosylase